MGGDLILNAFRTKYLSMQFLELKGLPDQMILIFCPSDRSHIFINSQIHHGRCDAVGSKQFSSKYQGFCIKEEPIMYPTSPRCTSDNVYVSNRTSKYPIKEGSEFIAQCRAEFINNPTKEVVRLPSIKSLFMLDLRCPFLGLGRQVIRQCVVHNADRSTSYLHMTMQICKNRPGRL